MTTTAAPEQVGADGQMFWNFEPDFDVADAEPASRAEVLREREPRAFALVADRDELPEDVIETRSSPIMSGAPTRTCHELRTG